MCSTLSGMVHTLNTWSHHSNWKNLPSTSSPTRAPPSLAAATLSFTLRTNPAQNGYGYASSNASPSPVGRTDFAPMLIQQLCDAPTSNPLGFYRVRIHGGSVYFTCDTTKGESVPRRAAAAIRKMVEAVDKGLPNPFWPAEWDHLLTRGGITFAPWGECAPRMTQTWEEAMHDMMRCA